MEKKIDSKRKTFMAILSVIFVLAITTSIVFATVVPSSTTPISDSLNSEDNTNNNSQSTDVSGLSEEEVEKILKELKDSTLNIDGAMQKLDELVNKAILTNNSTLKEYAEYAKQSLTLKKQLSEVQAKITALKSTSSSIGKIDDQLQNSLKVDVSYDDVKDMLSSSAADLLGNIDAETWAKIQDSVGKVSDLVKSGSNSAASQNLVELTMLNAASEEGAFSPEQQQLADNAINVAINKLRESEKAKYSSKEYDALRSSSQKFSAMGNKCAAALPDQIVMLGQSFKLKHAPIMYDNELLIALDDALQYINSTVQYSKHNSTIAIHSKDKMVEIAGGKNVAYVNDKAVNLAVPVLNFEGTTYITVEFFAQTYDVDYEYIRDKNFIVMYGNLNQLKDKETPNVLPNDKK